MAGASSELIFFFLLITAISFTTYATAAQFLVRNNCNYTVWPAYVAGNLQQITRTNCPHKVSAASTPPSGSVQLNSGQLLSFDVPSGTVGGRIWARTGCSFDDSGRGECLTGDCGGRISCTRYGKSPNTLAEYALNQAGGLDFFDISLVDGFNVPMEFVPTSEGCSRGPRCAGDVKARCPAELKAPGGCNNPCGVFGTGEYCCTGGGSCGPTNYSRYFKGICPDAYSYPKDDATSTFTCPGGTNYRVVFCP